jgi:outer membrane protein assembly factor BamB
LGGRLSAATIADGRVFVAQVDAQTVHALDAGTGDRLWSFTAGGRVDSPPTLVAGRVLFGSHDGLVYCLRASDGELVWRFLAAPRHLNAMAFDQPESVWPVHGSVLFRDGVVYAAAGRSSYLDGGIMLYGLDPVSGKVVAERRIQSEHAGIMEPPKDAEKYAIKNKQNWLDYKTKLSPDKSDSFAMQGATTDILVADGDSIYLRHMRFDRNLAEQKTKRPHLFSTSSLLDDWEHNRSYWILGTGDFYNTPVAFPWILRRNIQVPFGLMLAFDEQTVWGVHRAKGYTVFAMSRPDPAHKESGFPDFQARTSAKQADSVGWKAALGIRPRAMVRAGKLLFVGGMSADDASDPTVPVDADHAGKQRGAVHAMSCSNGETLREIEIASPPVWDGMAAAQGRLFIPCADGSLICLSSD